MTGPVLLVGHVVEVSGSRVVGQLAASVDNLYRIYQSRRYAIGQVGSIVKIEAGDHLVFGLVTSLRMVEAPEASEQKTNAEDVKWIMMDLLGEGLRTGLGEGSFEFRRGVHLYPLPGHRIYIATATELQQIYTRPQAPGFRVGYLSQAAAIPIYMRTDELLSKHFSVVGTTGSGKSCAVSLLTHSLVHSCPNAHVVVLDPHDEYAHAFADLCEPFDPTVLELPHWLLNLEESLALFIGRTEHAATSQANILKTGILAARQRFAEQHAYTGLLTVDTPFPYKISDLVSIINEQMPNQDGKKEPYNKILSKIDALRSDKRFSFLIRKDQDVTDGMVGILARLLRAPTDGRPVSVIDLSGVPSDVVDVLVSLLARLIFDFAVWTPRDKIMPVLLVCEEAHRYVPRSEEAAFEPARNALGRIAKEGRKYGVSLGLISQRPSELSDTALSQCNTIVALRMSNEQDQHFVKRALPDSIASVVDALPVMQTQEAIIAGEGVSVPVRLFFDTLPVEQLPRSQDVAFSRGWQEDSYDAGFVRDVVHRWRNQVRR